MFESCFLLLGDLCKMIFRRIHRNIQTYNIHQIENNHKPFNDGVVISCEDNNESLKFDNDLLYCSENSPAYVNSQNISEIPEHFFFSKNIEKIVSTSNTSEKSKSNDQSKIESFCPKLDINEKYQMSHSGDLKSSGHTDLLKVSQNSVLNIKCYRCEESLEFSEDHLVLPCGSCKICKSCIFNLINLNLQNDENTQLTCQCGYPISYTLFTSIILKDDLRSYLEKFSRINFQIPKVFICKCLFKINVETIGNDYYHCFDCKKTYCLRCLEAHDHTLTCKEFFNSQIKKCYICKKREIEEFDCKCDICFNCALEHTKEQLLDDPLDNPKCKKCNLSLQLLELVKLFGTKLDLIKFQEDSLLTSRFDCPICYKSKVVNGSITLHCNHRFCKSCLKSYLEVSVEQLNSSSVSIPCMICSQPISFHIINSILQGSYLNTYNNLLLRYSKPGPNPTEYLKFCNTCDYGAYISIDRDNFECKFCNKSICSKCNKNYSPNCCENLVSLNSLSEELHELVVKCPKCMNRIMKDSGCNFFKCAWKDCGNTFFCFLCKRMLRVRVI